LKQSDFFINLILFSKDNVNIYINILMGKTELLKEEEEPTEHMVE
jgi:hypothetical protein